jgi:hypothetical protein
MKCYSCGKNFRGSGPKAVIDGQERTYCADCYWVVKEEFEKMKKCDDCGYFGEGQCGKTGATLSPVPVGFNEYYVQAEKCGHYSIEKVGQDRKKDKKVTVLHGDVNELVKNLADRGQTLTYYCCHCGAPLKIGVRATEVQKTCPRCGCDLEVINLGKFINQHLQ